MSCKKDVLMSELLAFVGSLTHIFLVNLWVKQTVTITELLIFHKNSFSLHQRIFSIA